MSTSEGAMACPACGVGTTFRDTDGELMHSDGSPLCEIAEPVELRPAARWTKAEAGSVPVVPGKSDEIEARHRISVPPWGEDERRLRFPWGLAGAYLILALAVAGLFALVVRNWPS